MALSKEKQIIINEARIMRMKDLKEALYEILYNIPLTGKQKDSITEIFDEAILIVEDLPYDEDFGK